ncbi:MAG: 4Fe-4S binding protein [Desulfobulbales bacterium]|nr:4Fe-4S binding protein [Desulfobulbales bacterium]
MNDQESFFCRFFCPSTRDFYRAHKANPKHSLGDFIHGYIYGRWTYTYISVAKGKHALTKILRPLFSFVTHFLPTAKIQYRTETNYRQGKISFADGYHGKVMPLEKASKLITLNKPINLPDLEQIIPYTRARDIILENPDHIAVLKCPCRAAMETPCQPEEVCLAIGEPFSSFIVEHHPDKARRITQEEAVTIMEAEAQRGHVQHAFFKDAMLDRFYAICNCCSCCCGAINAHRHGTPMLASSGYVSEVDRTLCIGCGICSGFCPFDAIDMIDGLASINFDKCMGCGICAMKCEQQAILFRLEPAKGKPLDIYALQDPEDFSCKESMPGNSNHSETTQG